MGGEVEGDGHALLAGGEVAAVERIGVLGGGEAGILADRPGPLHVHRRVGAAEIGGDARHPVEEVEAREILRTISGLHRDPFGRLPRIGARGRGVGVAYGVEFHLGK